MKKPTLFSEFACHFFGHRYQISKDVTMHVKEYTCEKCQKELTTNENGNLTELTPKFREINSILERIHNNRITRISQGQVYNTKQQLEGFFNLH